MPSGPKSNAISFPPWTACRQDISNIKDKNNIRHTHTQSLVPRSVTKAGTKNLHQSLVPRPVTKALHQSLVPRPVTKVGTKNLHQSLVPRSVTNDWFKGMLPKPGTQVCYQSRYQNLALKPGTKVCYQSWDQKLSPKHGSKVCSQSLVSKLRTNVCCETWVTKVRYKSLVLCLMTSDASPGTSAAYFVPTSRQDSVLCRQVCGSETKISHFTDHHNSKVVTWPATGQVNTFYTIYLQEFNGPCWGFSRQSRRWQRTSFRTTRWGASFHICFLQTTQSCNSEAWSPASQRHPADRNKRVSRIKSFQPWHYPNIISTTCQQYDSRCVFQPLCHSTPV